MKNRFGIVHLYDYVADKTGYDRKVVKDIVKATFEGIIHFMPKGTLCIKEFGTYKMRPWGGWKMKNVTDPSEEVFIPERDVPFFSFSKKIRDRL